MLSYNAPDLFPATASPISSGDESDIPSMSHSTTTTPDSSVRGSSPISPEPNHLSSYFAAANGRKSTSSSEDAPKIPQRALSHTKKSHEILSAKRSVRHTASSSQASSTPSQTGSLQRKPSVTRASIDLFSANPEVFDTNPFGKELAQVRELAEEYGVKEKMQIIDEEDQELFSRGLLKFSADDYTREIQGLYSEMIGVAQPPTMLWI